MNRYSAIMIVKGAVHPHCSMGSWGQVRRERWHLSRQAWGVSMVSGSVKGWHQGLWEVPLSLPHNFNASKATPDKHVT